MTRTLAMRLTSALLLLALSAPLQGQSFGFAWWKDPQFQKDLTLTADQSARIDTVFQSAINQLRQKKAELDQQEAELSRLIAANADEATVIKQVDRVEDIRGTLNKARTLMLLRMRQVLTPEQRVVLNRLHDQWDKEHRRSRGEMKKQ